MSDLVNSREILEALIDEYDNKTITEHVKFSIGDLRYDPRDNSLYVCHGRVKGKYVWCKLVNRGDLSK